MQFPMPRIVSPMIFPSSSILKPTLSTPVSLSIHYSLTYLNCCPFFSLVFIMSNLEWKLFRAESVKHSVNVWCCMSLLIIIISVFWLFKSSHIFSCILQCLRATDTDCVTALHQNREVVFWGLNMELSFRFCLFWYVYVQWINFPLLSVVSICTRRVSYRGSVNY